MSSTPTRGFNRRSFLGLTGASVAAVATTGGLAGCGTAQSGGGAKASASVKLPTYKEYTGIKPDMPGNAEGLQPAFVTMPTSFPASVHKKPLRGSVTALTETFATPPPGMGSNPFWKSLNKALGGDLKLTVVADDYPDKFATMLAGGDLPDMMWVPPNQGIPNIGPMLEAKFADLTKYLSGDAVLDYPNLAALKPDSWKTAVVDGKIWGAPIPSTPFGQVYAANPEVWKKAGGFQATSADEFLAKCKEVTDPKRKVYALEAFYPNAIHMFGEWFGVPTTWRVKKNGSLVHEYETDEYKETLAYAHKVFKAGCFYPDSGLNDARPKVAGGSIGAYVSVGPKAISELRQFKPNLAADVMIPFGWDGKSDPVYDMGYGTVGFTPFKKASEKKIRELLDLINYLSAPFGTAEYLQKNFGDKGREFTFDSDDNPVLSKSGKQNVPGLVSALQIMSSPENPIYSAQYSQDTTDIYALEKKLLKHASRNPTAGTYSDTAAKVGAKLTQKAQDTYNDIVTGRKPVSAWDSFVKEWRQQGGDKMRDEYEKVLPDDVKTGKS